MADDESDDNNIVIGFSVQSISRTFFSGMLAGIEGAEAELEEKYGVNISIARPLRKTRRQSKKRTLLT